ncbi:MAG TPA: SDR family NAD(P)-dependent oxidoreductase [Longimicrobium sp.]
MSAPIALVGMACRYPGARTPAELWENVLAGRRAFRRIPDQRLRLADYASASRSAVDLTYVTQAALVEDWEFDRVRFRVSGSAYREADPAHWLALEVAAAALDDARLPGGEGLPRERTGVLVGNSLTGEFSRAGLLRLRWPYVRRVFDAELDEAGWDAGERRRFLAAAETRFKAPFPPPGEETLAGGLSNTIAGRICNHFDFKGGGYTVDGACASSLLAVAQGCSALAAGDLDAVVAGGVDLSLDPFELVGFARTGALAEGEMRVYDARSAGFFPGEGCAFVVLMRYDDALARRIPVYALVRGWGVSSDGSGGITRPEEEGQLLALRRAYARAGFGPETVAYFEGHGTGTAVGDATELRVLTRALREGGARRPAALGSVKAVIGHTKAAAGIAGVVKAAMALHAQVIPPATGCGEPHPELLAEPRVLRAPAAGEAWPGERPLRAGVSAMGFGGINAHVVLEGVAVQRAGALAPRVRTLLRSAQDAELFCLAAGDAGALAAQARELAPVAAALSRAELVDLAVHLQRSAGAGSARAAVVASTPEELARGLEALCAWGGDGVATRVDARAGVFLHPGPASAAPRLGLLFPGQGSPAHLGGGALRRRFDAVEALYAEAPAPAPGADGVATQVAQPAIARATLAALAVLEALGIEAEVAVGHSLGELAALHWAGVMDREALLRTAAVRGAAMGALDGPAGAMASLAAPRAEVEALLGNGPVVIAGVNAPARTVVSGPADAVAAVVERARARGWEARPLSVSHAFHSPLVAAAAAPLAGHLAGEPLRPPRRRVSSTVLGRPLAPGDDLRALLVRQVTAPVLFLDAFEAVRGEADLWIEAGPGEALSALAGAQGVPVVAMDACGPSLGGVLRAAGAAWTLGAPVRLEALHADRFARPFDPARRPAFLASPCEMAPVDGGTVELETPSPAVPDTEADTAAGAGSAESGSPLEVVRALVAERAELPAAAVLDEHRLLGDLHLNSITVGEIVARASRRLGVAPPAAPTEYASATVAGMAHALAGLAAAGDASPVAGDEGGETAPPGVGPWVRAFTVGWVEAPLPHRADRPAADGGGEWRVIAPAGHPLAEPLCAALGAGGVGSGTAVCLPPDPDERHLGLLLEGARAVLASDGPARFLLAQHGGGAASFARTLALEAPRATVCVVDLPPDLPEAAAWAVDEVRSADGYAEARYDALGRRSVPRLRLAALQDAAGPALGPRDVLLATGGAKGITAECALALARQGGAALALVGTSPAGDAAVAGTLERMAAAGVRARYFAADVSDAEAVRRAVRAAEAELGRVTAVLHGAAVNVPRLLGALDEAGLRAALAPKVAGMRSVLAALDPAGVRLVVGFGSIIARTGMPGEAAYALTNEWLAREVERFGAANPRCRCLTVEWSVWSAVGMGARLGAVDALARSGVTPIAPDEGVAMLHRLLAAPAPAPSVVVAGRFGAPPTLLLERPELPLFRFLEHPRVHYPGVELVAEADLSADTDPYLDDHVVGGERLLPAVLGLEAMAQAAMALAGTERVPAFEEVRFEQPVVVSAGGRTRVRLCALAHGDGSVEVALRSEATGFAADHFRARCRFGAERASGRSGPVEAAPAGAEVALDPARELYGPLFFHGGRFRRVAAYRALRARACEAALSPDGGARWFGAWLPPARVLGDPGARDAALHAIQACIPHALVLPVGVARVAAGVLDPAAAHAVRARETADDGRELVYDVDVVAADGTVCERWEGLRLRRVAPLEPEAGGWAPALLGPWLERRVAELVPGAAVSVAVERDGGADRRTASDRAIRRAAGAGAPVGRRPDGKPELLELPLGVSAAHCDGLTMGVAGPGPLGCDLERVAARPAALWHDLLGTGGFRLAEEVARATGDELDTAATRVWSAREALAKASGRPAETPALSSASADGWVILAWGEMVVATGILRIAGAEGARVVALAVPVEAAAAADPFPLHAAAARWELAS